MLLLTSMMIPPANIPCVALTYYVYDYLSGYSPRHMRNAVIDLFQTLDTEIKNRSSYLLDELKDFPYVNGGLFADE